MFQNVTISIIQIIFILFDVTIIFTPIKYVLKELHTGNSFLRLIIKRLLRVQCIFNIPDFDKLLHLLPAYPTGLIVLAESGADNGMP